MKYFRRKYLELLKLCVPLDLSRSCLHIFNHFCPLNWVHSFGLSCLFEVWNQSRASINQFTPYILPIFYWSCMQTCDACVTIQCESRANKRKRKHWNNNLSGRSIINNQKLFQSAWTIWVYSIHHRNLSYFSLFTPFSTPFDICLHLKKGIFLTAIYSKQTSYAL